MAFAWGRRNVANLYRYLDAQHHRTRFNNFFLVQRWDPEAALRQKAQELLRALHPTPGETLYLVIDDSKKAKRGKTDGRGGQDEGSRRSTRTSGAISMSVASWSSASR